LRFRNFDEILRRGCGTVEIVVVNWRGGEAEKFHKKLLMKVIQYLLNLCFSFSSS